MIFVGSLKDGPHLVGYGGILRVSLGSNKSEMVQNCHVGWDRVDFL